MPLVGVYSSLLNLDVNPCTLTPFTEQYKQEVIAAYQSSSLSAPDFARQCGIKYPTFAAWIAGRKRDESKPAPKSAPAFLIAELSAETGSPALEVHC